MMKVWLVIGYMGTGSGTLTYPEDFDLVGVFDTAEEAAALAEEKNAARGPCPECEDELDVEDPEDDPTFDDDCPHERDEMLYAVEEVDFFKKSS